MSKDSKFILAAQDIIDPRFKKSDEEDKTAGRDIEYNTIREQHLVAGAITNSKIASATITGDKLAELSITKATYHGVQLTATGSGWVRVAKLNNLSSVELWFRATRSGHHNLCKITGTYCFIGGGSPGVTFTMTSNARYGDGFTDARIVYAGTYDPVYLELYVPNANTSVSCTQISAFGNTSVGLSNVILESGSVPAGYASYQTAYGIYDFAVIMI
jgi:hypothetical protein